MAQTENDQNVPYLVFCKKIKLGFDQYLV